MKIALCTLFEGHYHFGVAALVNSLVSAGYEGTVWVGHRGPLPAWIVDRPGFDQSSSQVAVTPSLVLRAIELDPPVSLNYYKPTLMREILETHDPEASAVTYLDPDMVIKCDWAAMQSWLSADGVALVEDAAWNMPADHPKRNRWKHFFASYGEVPERELHRYYNAGLVCADRNCMPFLRNWERINTRVAAESGSGMRQRKSGDPDSIFHSTDEDALNFTLTLCGTALNAAGPEAMDFIPGGNRISHAVGAAKPWQGRHFRRALCGQPPSVASHWYYRFADGPLTPFSHAMLMRRRLSMALAAGLGRIWAEVHAARV